LACRTTSLIRQSDWTSRRTNSAPAVRKAGGGAFTQALASTTGCESRGRRSTRSLAMEMINFFQRRFWPRASRRCRKKTPGQVSDLSQIQVMKSLRVFGAAGQPLEIGRCAPIPIAGEGEIVRSGLKNCGVCGSDLHAVKYGFKMPPGTIMGHEFSAAVDHTRNPNVTGFRRRRSSCRDVVPGLRAVANHVAPDTARDAAR